MVPGAAFEIRLLHDHRQDLVAERTRHQNRLRWHRVERALERELTAQIKAMRPELLAEQGIGATTAATLIGRTAGAQRFPSDGHFARQAGVAPIPASSGRLIGRMRLNRGGDRRLNCALHRRSEACRCLKRHLARRVWHLMSQTPDQRPQRSVIINCNAPSSSMALT